jgi:hypothetical protein
MAETKQHILDCIADGSIGDQLSTPLTAGEVDALVVRSATDPGAPFESLMIARMAALKQADLPTFMRARDRLKAVKIKVSELDRGIASIDTAGEPDDSGGQGRAIKFPEVELWPDPVDGAALLEDIVAQIQRHVRLPREAAIGVALWVMHAHCFDAFTISPRLGIVSPEKRCGKTTLLGVIEALVPRPLLASNVTVAAVFRTIEAHRPTLLIDEADTFLGDNEELRGSSTRAIIERAWWSGWSAMITNRGASLPSALPPSPPSVACQARSRIAPSRSRCAAASRVKR